MLFLFLLPPLEPACEEYFEKEMEDSLFALTNVERARHELPPLKQHQDVRRVARAHSQDMARRNFFSHDSPEGLNVWDRLRNAGIWYASCAENVGRTLTVANAHRGFMESEGHRENILGKGYTHLGIGIVKSSDGYLYVTENFIEAIDTVDVDSTARLIEVEINKRRVNRRLSYLRRSATLDSLAAAHSLRMLRTGKPNIAQDFGNIRSRARAFHFVTCKVEEVFSEREVVRASGTRAGIGLIQGNSQEYGNGLLWITIIIVE